MCFFSPSNQNFQLKADGGEEQMTEFLYKILVVGDIGAGERFATLKLYNNEKEKHLL